MKQNIKSFSALAALAGAVLSAVAAVADLIYGLVYSEYFDSVVLLCLVASAVCLGLYAFMNKAATEFLNLLSVLALGFGLGLFFLNSYPVWADWWGHFDMYGSRGGVGPVISIIVVIVVAAICGIVSCFGRKEAN